MDAMQALRENAEQLEDGQWSFGWLPHPEPEALAIAEACLLLGTPVTDMVTSSTWLRLVDKIVALEERVTRLEGTP